LVIPSTNAGRSTTVLQSADGRTWTAADTLPGGLSWIQAAGRVDETFVLLGTDWTGQATVVTDNGAGWSAVSLADLLDAEGQAPQFMGATVGPEGVVATVAGLSGDPETLDYHVLLSGDAVTWSAESVADLIDEPVASVGRPVITGDRAVVPVTPIRPRGDDGHLQQVALVAALP
jgi:hypothetical protein